MSEVEKLTELFTRFPGIGPRQARRFVFFLLRQNSTYRTELIRSIEAVVDQIRQCSRCLRYASLHAQNPICDVCADPNRSDAHVMIVEKDTDVEQMERSGAYSGRYFVLGGTLSLTGKKGSIREQELAKYLETYGENLKEIILALSATPDGEYTSDYLSQKLKNSVYAPHASVSMLGRGLSTGSELEYADADTLSQAFKNRA